MRLGHSVTEGPGGLRVTTGPLSGHLWGVAPSPNRKSALENRTSADPGITPGVTPGHTAIGLQNPKIKGMTTDLKNENFSATFK